MKLFSRKALVAGAAAVALTFAGTSVPAADEVTTTETSTPQAPSGSSDFGNLFGSSKSVEPTNQEDGEDPENTPEDPNKPEENGSSDLDAKDITAWISVFTAVIGALGALFSFASKYLGFKL